MKQYAQFKDDNTKEHGESTEKQSEGDIHLEADNDSVIHQIQLHDEAQKNVKWRKLGNCYAAFFDKNDSPWITIGPNYGFVIGMITFVIFFEAVSFVAISITFN